MTRHRIRWIAVLPLLLGWIAPAAAESWECPEPVRTPEHRHVRGVAGLAALDPSVPVLLWLEPEGGDAEAKAAPALAAALKRLTLRPGSTIRGADLTGADLSGWRAPGLRADRVELAGAVLRGADLSGACFSAGSFEKADLTGARLTDLRVDQADLAGAVFRDADLTRATLACIPGVVGSGCVEGSTPETILDLRGARLVGADVDMPLYAHGAQLDGARLDGTRLPFDLGVLAATRAATVTSVVIAPAFPRDGEAQRFTAAELTTALDLLGSDPGRVIETRGAAPSFACEGPKLTDIERRICVDRSLAPLDRLLGDSWRRLDAAGREAEKTAQLAFLKQRDACRKGREPDDDCIRRRYVERLAALGARLRPVTEDELGQASVRLRGAPVALRPVLRDRPLAQRLLEAYGADANGGTIVRDGDGWRLELTAFGANTHTCGYEGSLTWYPGPQVWRESDAADAGRWIILPDGLVDAAEPEISRQLCGMRASWPPAFFVDP